MMFGMSAGAQDITGDWQGTLHAGKDLRIVLKITKDDGKLKVVGYSIDQGAGAMNATGATLDGKDFKFAVPGVGGSFCGKVERRWEHDQWDVVSGTAAGAGAGASDEGDGLGYPCATQADRADGRGCESFV